MKGFFYNGLLREGFRVQGLLGEFGLERRSRSSSVAGSKEGVRFRGWGSGVLGLWELRPGWSC